MENRGIATTTDAIIGDANAAMITMTKKTRKKAMIVLLCPMTRRARPLGDRLIEKRKNNLSKR